MQAAWQKDEALLADINRRSATPGILALWWLGQSGFLAAWEGRRVLFDPYLSDSLTEKYARTDKPHVRLTEQVIDPARLTGISVVTSSHAHTDHFDAATLRPLARANPALTLVLPQANLDLARERLEEDTPRLAGLDAGASILVDGVRLHGIAAAHNEVDRDPSGHCRYLGFVVELGPWRIYHSGDTLWHADLVAQLLPHRPHLALLPINGNRPERRVAGNLNGAEAAALARACGASWVVPCHYDMFAFNTESPQLFTETCRDLDQAHRVLCNGEGTFFAQA